MSAVAVTGIGATIVACGAGGFEITNLTLTGNARSHLQVGDRIMSIGSVVTTGKTDSEVKALILGPAGSTITMVCIALLSCVLQYILGHIFSRRAGSCTRPRSQADFIPP